RLLALLLHRLLWFVPTLLGLLAVTFVISRVIPSDPVALVAGETATPAQVAALRHQLGFDRPLPVQFIHYLVRLSPGALPTPLYLAAERRRSPAPPARHHRAHARRHGRISHRRYPARRPVGGVAQLVPRPRAARVDGLRSRHRQLLAGDHAAAAVRHASRVDAAQRTVAGLSAARSDGPLPRGRR